MSRLRFNPDSARNSCVSPPNRYQKLRNHLETHEISGVTQRSRPNIHNPHSNAARAHQSNYYAERVTGIEPALSAWEAEVLPLNYTRVGAVRKRVRKRVRNSSVKYAPSYLRVEHGFASRLRSIASRGQESAKSPTKVRKRRLCGANCALCRLSCPD